MSKYFFFTTIEQNSNLPPQFAETANNDYILYGETNDYSDYLVELYNRSSTHGAIVNGKLRYILGDGVMPNQDLPPEQLKLAEEWIKSVNEYGESLMDVLKPVILDYLIYNGYSMIAGKDIIKKIPKNMYYKDFSSFRVGRTKDTYIYSDYFVFDEKGRRRTYVSKPKDAEIFKKFSFENTTNKGVIYYAEPRPQFRFYPLPEYIGAVQDIETEIAIAEFHNNNVKSGFSAGYIIEFTNGVPEEDEKQRVISEVQEKYTQARNSGELFVTFTDSKERGVNVIPIRPNDLDKQFEVLRKDVTQSIITNHGLTSPMLMAIKTEGQLGGNNEILTAAQLFQNTYVNSKQYHFEKFINKWFSKIYGFDAGLYFEKLKPVKESLSLSSVVNDMTQDERREMAGLPPLTKEQKSELEANKKEEEKKALKFSAEDGTDQLLEALKQCATDLDGEIVAVRDCITEEDFDDMTLTRFEQSFVQFASLYDLPYYQSLVYKYLSENGGKHTIKQIADSLIISEQQAQLALTQLQEQNYLNFKILKDGTLDNFKINPISDAVLKDNVPPYQLETRWRYSGPNDDRTRKFCYEMLNAEGLKGKLWKRQAIDKLSIEQGRNVWLTRGGWYTLPNGNKRPSCRHIWQQVVIKIRNGINS